MPNSTTRSCRGYNLECGVRDGAMSVQIRMGPTLTVLLVVLVLGGFTLRYLQRAFFYPAPGPMSEIVPEEIGRAIARFEAAISAHAPGVLSSLQPGLSDAEIASIESRYRLRLTDELRAFYRWRNGSAAEVTAELVPGHRFVPLEEAAITRAALRQQVSEQPFVQRLAYYVFAGHRTHWLTVLDDLCGDGYFYDPARRRKGGSFFYHFAEIREYAFFPSFANFLVGAAECYEIGIYRTGASRTSEDYERSAELWVRYASSRGG